MDFEKITSDIDNYIIKGIPFSEDWFKYVQLVKITLLLRELKSQIPREQRDTFLDNFIEFAADKGDLTPENFVATFQQLKDYAAVYNVNLESKMSSLAYTEEQWAFDKKITIDDMQAIIDAREGQLDMNKSKLETVDNIADEKASLEGELALAKDEIIRLKMAELNFNTLTAKFIALEKELAIYKK